MQTISIKHFPEFQEKIRAVVKYEYIAFPNGSAYKREYIPEVFDGGTATKVYRDGYHIVFDSQPKTIYYCSFQTRGMGGGTNLGMHYCSQDQVLVDLH